MLKIKIAPGVVLALLFPFSSASLAAKRYLPWGRSNYRRRVTPILTTRPGSTRADFSQIHPAQSVRRQRLILLQMLGSSPSYMFSLEAAAQAILLLIYHDRI